MQNVQRKMVTVALALWGMTLALLVWARPPLPHQAKNISLADACPVKATVLAPGDEISTNGSTLGMADDFSMSAVWPCGDVAPASAPDQVFAVKLPVAGVLDVQVGPTSGGFSPALYLRLSCAQEYACFNFGSHPHLREHLTAGTYYFIIDGQGSTSGSYNLSVAFTAPACGDGVVSPGEQCDTGAGVASDGCTNCTADPPPPGTDSCPGEPVSLPPGTTILNGSTIGYQNDDSGSCSFPPGGPDRVYAVTPTSSGTLTASVGLAPDGATDLCANDSYTIGCWDHALYARTTCTDPGSEIGCSDTGAFDVETVSFPVAAGSTYFLFVDGYDDQTYSSGPFNLVLTLQ